MLPRSREWKHYFSLRHLNINLCDLFISPDVPVQSRLHQLPNRVAALFSPRRSSSELLFSHFRKKKQAGVTLPRLADVSPAEAKKKFSADFKSQSGCRCCCCCSTWSRTDVFLLRNFHFLSRLPREILGSTILLRTFQLLLLCSIWLISSCVQPFLFLPFTWEMTPSMLASHIQYVAVYDKLIYKQFIDTQRRKMFVFLQFNLVCSCVKDICVRWWSLRSGTPTLIVSPTWGFDAVHAVAHFLLSARNKTEAFLENCKRSILVKYLSFVIMRFFFLLSVSICGRRNSFCTFGWRVMLSVCLSYKYLMAEHINN